MVHRGDDGSADGYVSYRVKSDWVGGIPDSTLIVHDVLAPGPEVYAALWRYCLDVDLVATVSTVWAPVDEPLRWLLADPRRLRVNRLNDGLWLRILDVPAALAAREYGGGHGGGRGESGDGAQGRAGGDALVLDIADAFRPATAGRYLLEAGPDGAACCRTMRPADLALDISELGAAYLGGVGFRTLVRARRAQELTEGAAARADDLFRTDRAPWCSTHF